MQRNSRINIIMNCLHPKLKKAQTVLIQSRVNICTELP